MLSGVLLAAYAAVVTVLAVKNWRLALGLLVVLLPAYLVRWHVGPVPATMLELTFGIIFLVWLAAQARTDWREIVTVIKQHRLFFIFLGIFFASSVASIFVSDMAVASLVQWRAYILEPILLFFILLGRRTHITRADLVWMLALSTLSISVYSLIQQFTGWGIATAQFQAEATRRVTAFYTSPNAVGLYLGPVMLLMFGVAMAAAGRMKRLPTSLELMFVPDQNVGRLFIMAGLLLLVLIAVIFTKSEGTFIALAAGGAVFFYLLGWKKTVIAGTLATILLTLAVPRFKAVVLLADKAGHNRLQLWSYSWEFLSASPKNFVLGTGIRQFFRKIQKPHYNPQELERLIYPHNIALNFWTELGLPALVGMAGMIACLARLGYSIYRREQVTGAALLAALAILVVHGLVDVPYFKNDLAMEWWIITALFFAPA